jgi:hypothetical protein
MPVRERSLLRSIAAALHRLTGGLCFHLGRHRAARCHFERVLELRGDDFRSYVYLGRIAYKMGDYAAWRRQCGHAQRTSPVRYARLRHPFELFEPRAAGTLFEPSERASWRSFRVSQVGTGPRPMASDPDTPALDACPEGPVRRFGDDFLSDAEREKFRHLAPIDHEDVSSVDLDELTRRL